jgi:hypothetical protein
MRPGGDAPFEAVGAALFPNQAATALQRNGVLVFHMA